MSYSYAFGDHTLFLDKDVCSYPSLSIASHWFGGHGLLYVYRGAEFKINMDYCVGGELVAVIEYVPLMQKVVDWKWGRSPPRDASATELLERYIRRLVRCRLKGENK